LLSPGLRIQNEANRTRFGGFGGQPDPEPIPLTTDHVADPDEAVTTTGLFKMTELLIQHGCDVNAQDNLDKHSVLHHLAVMPMVGAETIAKHLISNHGAKVDLRDAKGRTPFMLALEYGHFSFAEFLVKEAKCQVVGMKTSAGETAMHVLMRKVLGMYYGGYDHLPHPFSTAGLSTSDVYKKKTQKKKTKLQIEFDGRYLMMFLLQLFATVAKFQWTNTLSKITAFHTHHGSTNRLRTPHRIPTPTARLLSLADSA
jgi:hypothetical protein